MADGADMDVDAPDTPLRSPSGRKRTLSQYLFDQNFVNLSAKVGSTKGETKKNEAGEEEQRENKNCSTKATSTKK